MDQKFNQISYFFQKIANDSLLRICDTRKV